VNTAKNKIPLEELRGYLRGNFPNGRPVEFEQTSGGVKRR